MDLEKMTGEELLSEYYFDICSLKNSEWNRDFSHVIESYQQEVNKTKQEILRRLKERDELKQRVGELDKSGEKLYNDLWEILNILKQPGADK